MVVRDERTPETGRVGWPRARRLPRAAFRGAGWRRRRRPRDFRREQPSHIRAVTERFAKLGYAAIAPALFDRLERDVEFDYTEATTKRGRELRTALGWDAPALDIGAAVAAIAPFGRTAVVGYCWGGSCAWLSACRAELVGGLPRPACAIAYYGGQIIELVDESPRVPVLLHFGESDPIISREHVATIRSKHPDAETHVYPAGHGFACDQRGDFDAPSERLALDRTLRFLKTHLSGS
jgi:carboxymethylenebutenolidase